MKKLITILALWVALAPRAGASTQAELYGYPVDIPEGATAEELASYRALKAAYLASIANAGSAAAESYVRGLKGADGSWAGIPTGTVTQAQLATVMGHVRDLARAAKHGSSSAQAALDELLNALTFRGYKGAGGITFTLATNDYGSCVTIAQGCVEAAAVYGGTRRRDWLDFPRRICTLGQVYNPHYRTEINVDYMYNVAPHIFSFPYVVDDEALGVRHLKACSRYLARFVEPTDGKSGGLKADGTGFHHGAHYPNYMYCFNAWFELAGRYRGTPFRVSEEGFRGAARHVMCMYLTSTKPTGGASSYMANALAGRNPYGDGGLNNRVSRAQFELLLEVGRDITGSYDAELAAAYCYFFDLASCPYGAARGTLDGFYQFNYSPAGVLRGGSWVATMRAPTADLWGAEIYSAENRFGVYQSNGTLEVMYRGDLRASGVPNSNTGAGWDWNVVPGATTVHFTSWTSMMPGGNTTQRFDQYSTRSVAGALAAGSTGVFAADFEQGVGGGWNVPTYRSTGLRFKKSYFAFGDMVVALGSNICASGAAPGTGVAATNLFQNIVYEGVSGSLVHNGAAISSPHSETTDHLTPGWFVTPAGTGYYVPGGQPVTVVYGEQTSPSQTGSDHANPTTVVTAAKAYLSHGRVVTDAAYEFVVVPGVDAAAMAARAAELANPPYTVLRQDATAHVLHHHALRQTCYAAFAPLAAMGTGAVAAIDAPALAVLDERSPDTLRLAVCSPDLNLRDGASVAVPITLTLRGFWACPDAPAGVALRHLNAEVELTQVTVQAVRGLSAYLALHRSGYLPPTTGVGGGGGRVGGSAFPNPTQGVVTLPLPQELSGAVEVHIYSVGGVLLRQLTGAARGGALEVDLRPLSAGAYCLRVTRGRQQVAVARVLKQ